MFDERPEGSAADGGDILGSGVCSPVQSLMPGIQDPGSGRSKARDGVSVSAYSGTHGLGTSRRYDWCHWHYHVCLLLLTPPSRKARVSRSECTQQTSVPADPRTRSRRTLRPPPSLAPHTGSFSHGCFPVALVGAQLLPRPYALRHVILGLVSW